MLFHRRLSVVLFGALLASATVSLSVSAAIPAVTPPARGGDIIRTKGTGDFGSVDSFLTDVVPDWPGWNRRSWTDEELWGNQGYIIGGPRKKLVAAGPISGGATEELSAIIQPPALPDAPVEKIDLGVSGEKPSTHTVVKGECLWIISGYERIYGNPLKWPLIYKANKDRIKHPDLIYPGQVFIIPRD